MGAPGQVLAERTDNAVSWRRMPNLKPVPIPQYCRRHAYELFAAQLPQLRAQSSSLVRAAIAISMHQLDDVNPDSVIAQLDHAADRIRQLARSGLRRSVLAYGHQYLFDKGGMGLAGNRQDYFNPQNSYLPRVLQSRSGAPVTLALVYKYVFDQLGVPVVGINSPGHFLVAVEMDNRSTLVDPFSLGKLLTHSEAERHIKELSGVTPRPGQQMFVVASPEAWLARILHNLESLFQRSEQAHNVAAMMELRALLSN
jgi:regulator of sirC expression with transglutaminase-like and TPR domain